MSNFNSNTIFGIPLSKVYPPVTIESQFSQFFTTNLLKKFLSRYISALLFLLTLKLAFQVNVSSSSFLLCILRVTTFSHEGSNLVSKGMSFFDNNILRTCMYGVDERQSRAAVRWLCSRVTFVLSRRPRLLVVIVTSCCIKKSV